MTSKENVMNKRLINGIAFLSVAALGTIAWAAVPPPPANQSLFIYDTSFDKFTVNDCHGCHGTDPSLVLLHHALINNPATGVIASCINSSGTVPATLATGCHTLTGSSATGFAIADAKDCFACHTQSPHHMTTPAADQDCKFCHGAAIDNPKDGHYLPSYATNTGAGGVTPAPSGRTVTDPTTGQSIIVQGCAACHQASSAVVPVIVSNKGSHHGTGIGQGLPGTVGNCTWCHDALSSPSSAIRACEACHGVNSLHNIQLDSPATANLNTVSPGNELKGYGHIGNNWDCQGCHYSWTGTASLEMTTAVAPSIKNLSTTSVIAGKAATLTITGNSFLNSSSSGATNYAPKVTLTDAAGTVITLTPFAATVSEIQVTLPNTLKPGVYDVRVDKSGTFSNRTVLVVSPEVRVDSAVVSGSSLTISGAGFGSAPPVEFQKLLGVFYNGIPLKPISWTDTKIAVSSTGLSTSGSVTVKTLYNTVTTTFGSSKRKK